MDVVGYFLRAALSVAIFIISFFLDLLFTLFGEFNIPSFSTFSQYLINFWDLCFQFIGYIRSMFLIDMFSMQLISTMLIIRFTYKPTIAVIKWLIGWISKLRK